MMKRLAHMLAVF